MDLEVAKALKYAQEKVRVGEIKDFELILDVAGMSFVWVSAEAAKLCGHTVSELIGSNFFETTEIPREELRAIIMGLAKKGGRFTISIASKTGTRNVEMEFRPVYVTKERPFLIGNILK